MADRSELLLGITCWVKQHPGRLRSVLHLDLDSVADPSAVLDEFLRIATGIDRTISAAALVRQGQDALRDGVSAQTQPAKFAFSNGQSVESFPAFELASWKRFESTFPPVLRLARTRIERFPQWEDMSCAMDATTTIAQCLGLFTQQADEMSFARLRSLSPVAVCLWLMCTTLTKNREQERGLMALYKQLLLDDQTAPSHTTLRSKAGVNDTVIASLAGVPSVSYTRFRASVCCDGRPRWQTTTPQRILTEHSLGLRDQDTRTVAAALQDTFFSAKQVQRDEQGFLRSLLPFCSRGAQHCTRLSATERVVLVRLPPILLVVLEGGGPLRDARRHYFDDLQIDYTVLPKDAGPGLERLTRMKARYRLRAATMCHAEHFTALILDIPGHRSGVYQVNAEPGRATWPKYYKDWTDALRGYSNKALVMNLWYEVVQQDVHLGEQAAALRTPEGQAAGSTPLDEYRRRQSRVAVWVERGTGQ